MILGIMKVSGSRLLQVDMNSVCLKINYNDANNDYQNTLRTTDVMLCYSSCCDRIANIQFVP